MKKVNGNIKALLEVKTVTKNEIGEGVKDWQTLKTLYGWLDLSNGSADYQNYNAKIQESTHVFICDWQPLDVEESECRLTIAGKHYEIVLIDNPMELNYQLELFLKYVGD
ncbi:MAG: head-tail adaptor protein [Erysipelotrichia bacterium]|nr:head-tail adaptor protein [Erysipelotrichia bacterium]